jgi:hypothetical protein
VIVLLIVHRRLVVTQIGLSSAAGRCLGCKIACPFFLIRLSGFGLSVASGFGEGASFGGKSIFRMPPIMTVTGWFCGLASHRAFPKAVSRLGYQRVDILKSRPEVSDVPRGSFPCQAPQAEFPTGHPDC